MNELNDLIELIEKELLAHKNALSMSSKKLEIIKKKDIQELQNLIRDEEVLIERIKILEKERIVSVQKLGYKTLLEIVETIDDENVKKKFGA
jgi:hypothetical protein